MKNRVASPRGWPRNLTSDAAVGREPRALPTRPASLAFMSGRASGRARYAESGEVRRHDLLLMVRSPGRDPVIRDRLDTIEIVGSDHARAAELAFSEIGTHVVPDHLSLRRHLEDVAELGLVDQRIAVGQPLHRAHE